MLLLLMEEFIYNNDEENIIIGLHKFEVVINQEIKHGWTF